MWARAEEAGQLPSYRQSFCVAVARSVAKMPVLAELTLPLVRLDGCVVAQKSLQADFSEVAAAEGGIKRCGGVLESIMPAWPEQWTAQGHMPEASISTDDRDKSLVVLRKISNTPAKYPRPPGMPKKSPL